MVLGTRLSGAKVSSPRMITEPVTAVYMVRRAQPKSTSRVGNFSPGEEHASAWHEIPDGHLVQGELVGRGTGIWLRNR